MSSDRAGESMERDEVKRRDRGEDGQKRPRPVSLVRTMSVNVDSALAGEIFDHFCNAGTLKSILRSYRYGIYYFPFSVFVLVFLMAIFSPEQKHN